MSKYIVFTIIRFVYTFKKEIINYYDLLINIESIIVYLHTFGVLVL